MADWKIISLCGFFNAAISVISVLIFYPLVVLGPLASGLLAVVYSRGYEDYYVGMDQKDAAVIGVLSGIVGALIAGLIFLLGTGIVGVWVGLLNTNLGTLADYFIAGYLIIQVLVILNMIVGAIGGLIGFKIK
jgi:hypothetical protein